MELFFCEVVVYGWVGGWVGEKIADLAHGFGDGRFSDTRVKPECAKMMFFEVTDPPPKMFFFSG